MLKVSLIVFALLVHAATPASADADCKSDMPNWMAAAFCDHGSGDGAGNGGGEGSDTGDTDTGGSDTGDTDGGTR